MSMSELDLSDIWVTQAEACEFIGISHQYLNKLENSNRMPKRRGREKYNLRDFVRNHDEVLRADRRNAEEPEPGPSDTAERIAQAKLVALERENALRNREVAPISLLEEYAAKVGAVVHSGFEALPGQVKKGIPHLRGAELDIFRNLLAKLANRIADFDVSNTRAA